MGSITEGTKALVEGLQKRKQNRENEAIVDFVQSKVMNRLKNDPEKMQSFDTLFEKIRKSGMDVKDTINVVSTIQPDIFKDLPTKEKILEVAKGLPAGTGVSGEVQGGLNINVQPKTDIQDVIRKRAAEKQTDAAFQPQLDELAIEKKRKMKQVEQEAKELESAQKLGTAVKRLSILNKQFNEALPTYEKGAVEQRVAGKLEAIGAKWGVSPNPKLLALLTNSRPVAINLVRAFGEVGNLSESEQRGALDVVDQAGLTEEERLEKVRQFAEFALAGATPKSLEGMMKDENIVEIVKNLGIKVPGHESELKKGSKGKLPNGIEFEIL